MRSTTLDPESTKALHYLQSLLGDDLDVDTRRVEVYIDYFKFNPNLITNGGNVLHSPVLVAFVPLLERLLRARPNKCFGDFLLTLLQPLRLNDIFKFFPRNEIEAAARLSLALEVMLATRVVHNVCKYKTEEAYDFVRLLEFMSAAVQQMLTNNEIPTETVQQLEELMSIAVEPCAFLWDRWRFLLEYVAPLSDKWGPRSNAQFAARYVAVLQVLLTRANYIPVEDVAALCSFDTAGLFDEESEDGCLAKGVDWFLPAIIFGFYARLAALVPFACIRDPVDHCMAHLAHCRSGGVGSVFVDPYLDKLLGALSHSNSKKKVVRSYLEQYPELIEFNLEDNATAFTLLSLDVIPKKKEFFDKHFGGKALHEMPQKLFECVLWLVSDEEFFSLTRDLLINDRTLDSLPILSVFQVLDCLASYDWSAQALVSDFPFTTEQYLCLYRSHYTLPDVCNLQKHTLQMLLSERRVGLGHWHESFTTVLLKITNGGWAKQEPQVQIETNFA